MGASSLDLGRAFGLGPLFSSVHRNAPLLRVPNWSGGFSENEKSTERRGHAGARMARGFHADPARAGSNWVADECLPRRRPLNRVEQGKAAKADRAATLCAPRARTLEPVTSLRAPMRSHRGTGSNRTTPSNASTGENKCVSGKQSAHGGPRGGSGSRQSARNSAHGVMRGSANAPRYRRPTGAGSRAHFYRSRDGPADEACRRPRAKAAASGLPIRPKHRSTPLIQRAAGRSPSSRPPTESRVYEYRPQHHNERQRRHRPRSLRSGP